MIPRQLQRAEFRFIKIKSDKIAIEKGWQKDSNYLYYESEFEKWLLEHKRYGIVCGFGGLLVVDFDDRKTQEEIMPLLPETFTIKTAGKGLCHLYYMVDNPVNHKLGVADLQGEGAYVVGASSKMLYNKMYDIIKDI